MHQLYSTSATATGDGREGAVRTADGLLDVPLAAPTGLGGAGGDATNPEQLFAAGYSACFHSALLWTARSQGVRPVGSSVTAQVALLESEAGMRLSVALTAHLPGVPEDVADALVAQAHQVCPYSAATRGEVEVAVRRG
ncbi:organic hydroperoxide resistance protein [Actinokineospora bangkokensis]|uniref:Organic hydroperoxide resistance protein n=1 Tax=Actinokineospora bangkokensis TaxID=1193682 RepID=A0A1Q9LTY4_9PSEU|nr:organic hydroperoxide resistance protein [Actinokineospora bangkokensis]OLR95488.1 organic hydroperoxide resistance protein [Actinokineospora bangkokensis]